MDDLTAEFCGMVRHKIPNELTAWLMQVETKPLPDLHSFGKGIQKDFVEVSAALDVQWSNGQTEGQVNRLKKDAGEPNSRHNLCNSKVIRN